MTTTPNPTAAEHEEAPWDDEDARLADGDHAEVKRLRVQLAESERARKRLRALLELAAAEEFAAQQNGAGGFCNHTRDAIRDALAADQTTARESAENTAEETMTEQTSGAGGEARCPHNVTSTNLDGTECWVCGVRLSAPAQPPEHAEYCNLTLDGSGRHAGQCRYICGPGNAKAKTPAPVEPSDETAERYFLENDGFLDALTRRVEALEVAYGTIIAKQDEMESRVSGLSWRA